jgi:hypothetical protein
MNQCKHIAQDQLKLLLRYEPETGLFFWLHNKGPAKAGNLAGTPTSNGYVNICVNRKLYKAHRLAWLYVFGNFPKAQIDHINGVKNDNRFANLREATCQENAQNHVFFGGHYVKEKNKWQSNIRVGKKRIHLGLFLTKDEAHEAYINAKKKFHIFQPIQRNFL